MSTSTILYALLGGILPALLWLAFWLREDNKRPEPRGLVLRTFLIGMLAVVLVLPFQQAVDSFFPGAIVLAFLLWAILEEAFKFGAAYLGGLNSKYDDEPIDNLIYLITAALGFTALENALFIANPLLQADIAGSILTGNIRFIGASLLHIVSSAIIGVTLALTFYKPKVQKVVWVAASFVFAVAFHTLFNLAILNEHVLSTPMAFVLVWLSIVIILLFCEKIKTLSDPVSPTPLLNNETNVLK